MEKINSFIQVKGEIDFGYRNGANILIVTFPGYSVNRYLKKIAESNEFEDLVYINTLGQKLGKYNLLDFDFASNFKESLSVVEQYIKQAKLDQKFAVLINGPWVLENEMFESSYLGTHHYRVFKYTRPDVVTVKLFAKQMKVELDDKELERLYWLAGGAGRLGKYLLLHPEAIKMEPQKVLENEEVLRMVKYMVSCYRKVGDEILEEYGVKESGKFTSALVEEYYKQNTNTLTVDIRVDKDLGLFERGERVGELTKSEANILRFMINNDGVIKKDEVAEAKWGDKSFVDFSDEAIKKTMQRLGDKFREYKLEAIHGYGYKLVLK